MRRLTLVVNPAAGRGRARRLLPKVVAELRRGVPDLDLRVHEATSYDDARRACDQVVAAASAEAAGASESGGLLMLGGDGSVHLGLGACAETGVPLGIIPAGTGNDFCRGVGLPTRWREAVATIAAGHLRTIDLMSVTGATASGEREWVGSIVSTGFDEKVNYRTNTLPVSVGAPSYAWSVLYELRRFNPLRYRLRIDGVEREIDAMLVAVGNAGVFGGGIRICPDADVADGLLDVTIVHAVGRGTLLKLFPQIFTGEFITHPAIERLRAVDVNVDGDDLWSMADGEKLGRVPLDCRAIPGALRVFAPE